MSKLSTDPIVEAYFDQKNILVKHQIESYDDYVDNILPNIIQQHSPIKLEFTDKKIRSILLHLKTDTIIIEDSK